MKNKLLLHKAYFDKTQKNSYIKCVYIFSAISIISTVGFSLILYLIECQKINSHIVNICGRQRMLSQRTTLFGLSYLSSGSRNEAEEYRSLLKDSINQFEKSHFGLVQGSEELNLPGKPTVAERKMYFEAPINIDKKVRSHITRMRFILSKDYSDLKISTPAVKDSIKKSAHDLLDSLDAIVQHYESKGEKIIEKLHKVEIAVWLTTLVMLIISIHRVILYIYNNIKEKDNETKEMVSAIIVFYNHQFNNKLASSMFYLESEKENIGEETFTKIFDPLLELTEKVKNLREVFHKKGFQYESYSGGKSKIFKL